MVLLLRNSAPGAGISGSLNATLGALTGFGSQSGLPPRTGNLGGGGGTPSYALPLVLVSNSGGGAPAILASLALNGQATVFNAGPVTGILVKTLDALTVDTRRSLASIKLLIEIGVGNNGTSLLRTLINHSFCVLAMSLSELAEDHKTRDLSAAGNHGMHEGPGFLRGITVDDLPDGGLATRFGGGVIKVPSDGQSGGGLNLSLAGGSMDHFIFFRSSVVDNNQRGLVTKYHAASQTGWATYLNQGRVVTFLVINNTLVYNFATPANICDGNWKRVHVCYEPEQLQCRIFVNGVVVASVATGNIEPIATSASVVIGGWDHLVTLDSRFLGDMHYVMLSREGKPTLGAEIESACQWTNISDDAHNMHVEIGDTNMLPLGTTAPVGKANFKLLNPTGKYSPGHVNMLNGFGLANPIRVRTVEGNLIRPLYRGFISDINPATGPNGEKMTAIDCVDSMEILAVTPIGDIDIVLNRPSDYCIRRLLDQATRPPNAVSIEPGNEVFPTAFDQVDGVTGKLMQEVADVTRSEGGMVYVKRDGTWTYESRQRRQSFPVPVATLIGDWQEIEIGQGFHEIINVQRATVYPREFGLGTNDILTGSVSPDARKRRVQLEPGVAVPITGSFSDPLERSMSVGGMDLQPLLPTTDYTMTENEDGSGENLTNFLQILSPNPPMGGSSFSMTVLNTHPVKPGWLHYQIRGRILRRFDPQTTFFEDPDSRNQFFHREPPSLNLRYLSEITAGFQRCKYMVNLYKTPTQRPRMFQALLDLSNANLRGYLNFEIGDAITIGETQTGLQPGNYWIQALTYDFLENSVIRARIVVVPSSTTGSVFIVGHPTFGIVGSAIVGF